MVRLALIIGHVLKERAVGIDLAPSLTHLGFRQLLCQICNSHVRLIVHQLVLLLQRIVLLLQLGLLLLKFLVSSFHQSRVLIKHRVLALEGFDLKFQLSNLLGMFDHRTVSVRPL